MCDRDTRQLQLQLPDTRRSLEPILLALWSSQTHGKKPNIVYELERFVTNSKAFVTLQAKTKTLAAPTTASNSLALNRQASAADPTEERSPMPEEATNVPSDNVENPNIRRTAEYQPLFSTSTISKPLEPPPVFDRSLLFQSSKYIVDQILDFLQGLSLYEPPLPANYVRLQWICVSHRPLE